MKVSIFLSALVALWCLVSFDIHAQQLAAKRFIDEHGVETYDCPDSEIIPQLDAFLTDQTLPASLKYRLEVEKSHWLICMGKYTQARDMLQSLISQPDIKETSLAYASATYQLGFIFDVFEDPERCQWYAKAEELSQQRHPDVYLSAQLGSITVCGQESGNNGMKLGRLYSLLELYLARGDKPAVAHIHNNIGLLYGSLGQHVLAAEQYQKSYEMGLGVYEGSNLLATLISVITSQMASGDFEGARQSIEEFKRQNIEVNTPLTNVWLHFAEAGYYYRVGNYDELENSLAKWQVYLPQINNRTYDGLYRWYNAALCLHKEDVPCLQQFMQDEANASEGYRAFVSKNKDYLRMQVDIQLFLGNVEAAKQRFSDFADMMLVKSMDQQASGKVLGVANLHNQIINLETDLATVQNQRVMLNIIIAITLAAIFVVALIMLRRHYLRKRALDPLTGLLNGTGVKSAIKRVGAPAKGRTNALALFDLAVFQLMNRQVDSMNSERAVRHVASILQQVTREQDILGRFGNEQFIMCLTNIEEGTAKAFFERVRRAIENTVFSVESGEGINLDSSINIYVTTSDFDDLEEVLADMNNALRRSKDPFASQA